MRSDSTSCDGMVVSPALLLDKTAQCRSCSGVYRVLVWHVPLAWPEGAEDLGRDRRVASTALPSADAPVWRPGWHDMFCFKWTASTVWPRLLPRAEGSHVVLKTICFLSCASLMHGSSLVSFFVD